MSRATCFTHQSLSSPCTATVWPGIWETGIKRKENAIRQVCLSSEQLLNRAYGYKGKRVIPREKWEGYLFIGPVIFCLPVLFVILRIYLYIYPMYPIHPFYPIYPVYLYVYLSICLSVYLSIYLFICLSVCLCISMFAWSITFPVSFCLALSIWEAESQEPTLSYSATSFKDPIEFWRGFWWGGCCWWVCVCVCLEEGLSRGFIPATQECVLQ